MFGGGEEGVTKGGKDETWSRTPSPPLFLRLVMKFL